MEKGRCLIRGKLLMIIIILHTLTEEGDADSVVLVNYNFK